MQRIELRCEICSLKFDANYNIPKVLSCGHTVCAKCVDRMRDKEICKCPFDRKILDFEEDNIAINYYILSLIDNSVQESSTLNPIMTDEDDKFEINPRPVINSPGWKNTLDGFIKNDVLYTVETNGFIYCTDLNTGEWWFMYHNQFFGNFFFENKEDGKMYLIDQYGSLFQIFNKNYYVQMGKKNAWKNTVHMTVFNNKLYSLETTNKFYETNLLNGKWKEIVVNKSYGREARNYFDANGASISHGGGYFSKSGNESFRSPHLEELNDSCGMESKLFKGINMVISTPKNVLFSNKSGELYMLNESTSEAKVVSRDFFRNIESYYANSTHVYFFEKNSKVVYRTTINVPSGQKKVQQGAYATNPNASSSSNSNTSASSNNELSEKYEEDLKKKDMNYGLIQNIPHSANKQSNTNYQTEIFIDLDLEKIPSMTNGSIIVPIKIIVDDTRVAIIDKIGDLYIFSIATRKLINNFQCLFMLRNCHLNNTALIGDGDLLLLDPIRLSLNKLNIIAGTEVIVLHSTKFLYTIKQIFSANSRIYFIDTAGNLYYFNETDKKLTQIGNNSICKYIVDFAVHKNYLLTVENNTLYKTNLNDGNYIEIKNDYCRGYEYFFADNINIIFISKDDKVHITSLGPSSPKDREEGVFKDSLKHKKTLKFDKISQMGAVTYFRSHIVFYNREKKTIESLNIDDGSHKKMVENFPDVNMFICNSDFLSCVTRDGVIYKLYC